MDGARIQPLNWIQTPAPAWLAMLWAAQTCGTDFSSADLHSPLQAAPWSLGQRGSIPIASGCDTAGFNIPGRIWGGLSTCLFQLGKYAPHLLHSLSSQGKKKDMFQDALLSCMFLSLPLSLVVCFVFCKGSSVSVCVFSLFMFV